MLKEVSVLPRQCLPLLLAILSSAVPARSQVNVKDTVSVSMIYPAYALHLPSGDMSERYGMSNSIGAGFTRLFHNRWILSVEGNFLFSDNVKNPGSILSGIVTSDGHVISEDGTYANVMILERGFTLFVKAGKLFPVLSPNPNSGLVISAGAGLMQHKYRIEVPGNNAPQVNGDYKKGYDRMCNGPALTECISYQYLGNNRKINGFIGVEFVQAWTKSRRIYYISDMLRPAEKRFDLLSGFKIGWYIPFYKKTKRTFYYN
jgi:hypothetical protein